MAYLANFDDHTEWRKECCKGILEFVHEIINTKPFLQHLDLSGLELGDKIISILNCIIADKSKSLLSLNLSDNYFSEETRALITQKLDIVNVDPRRDLLDDQLHLQRKQEVSNLLQNIMPDLLRGLKVAEEDAQILNTDIR